MRLSYAQIILISHAGGVNSDRMHAKMKQTEKASAEPGSPEAMEAPADDTMFEGKPITELDSSSYLRYLSS